MNLRKENDLCLKNTKEEYQKHSDNNEENFLPYLEGMINGTMKMKSLFTILILLISIPVFSQITRENGKVTMPETKWNEFQDNFIISVKTVFAQDTVISRLDSAYHRIDSAFKKQETRLADKDSIIRYQKQELVICKQQQGIIMNSLQPENKPLIEWMGFYITGGSGYFFSDSTISKTTFFNALTNNIYIGGKAIIKIKDFLLSTFLQIPFEKIKKVGLMFEIGYKIF